MTELKRGDLVKVHGRNDEWDGTIGIVARTVPGSDWVNIACLSLDPDDDEDDGDLAVFMRSKLRPLVVLDPDLSGVIDIERMDPAGARKYADHLEGRDAFGAASLVRHIADQIEAQTKPARIEEPGLWGVVEAHVRGDACRRWVKYGPDWRNGFGNRVSWAELIDPILVREGV